MAEEFTNTPTTILPIFSLLLPLLTTLLLLSLHLKSKKRRAAASKKPPLPPGETGLPWIGETMEFFRAQQRNRLFEDFIRPRAEKHGRTFKTRLMGSPTIIINGAEANKFFLSSEFKLVVSSWPTSSVQLMGRNSIMEKTGAQHRSVRAIIASSLGGSGLEAMAPKICGIVSSHLGENWGGGERVVSLYRSAKFMAFRVTCECLFEMEAKEAVFECFERVLEGVFSPPVNVPGTSFWRAKRARAEVERVLVGLVRGKRREMEERERVVEEGANTLLSRMVGALIRGEMTEVEVVDNMVLLVFAAHDTTSFAIAMVFKMLAQHPDCLSLLLQGTRLNSFGLLNSEL